MTGPEHYREAEILLADADSSKLTTYEGNNPEAARTIAAAQVHATLALAAATALIDETPRSDSFAAYRAWQNAAGVESVAHPAAATSGVAFVFKAAWGMTPLGTYTNLRAAQTHCEADATNNAENPEGLSFKWFGDAHWPGDPCELLLTVGGVQKSSNYTVTRVEVDTEYDPEADA